MSFFSKNILTKQELQQIADTIQAVEKETIGEIRVSIRKNRSYKDRKLSLYDLAMKNFYELGMDKTKAKTGAAYFDAQYNDPWIFPGH